MAEHTQIQQAHALGEALVFRLCIGFALPRTWCWLRGNILLPDELVGAGVVVVVVIVELLLLLMVVRHTVSISRHLHGAGGGGRGGRNQVW